MMMMTNPITPPPELVHQLRHSPATWLDQITIAYAAGADADMQLDVMLAKMEELHLPSGYADTLRAYCRPKPPSLKEQALAALEALPTPAGQVTTDRLDTIRRALEALPE